MGRVLTFDPGRLHTGYAVFDGNSLVEAGSFRRVAGKRKRVVPRDEEITKRVQLFLDRVFQNVEVIIIEAAQLVDSKGLVEIDPEHITGRGRSDYHFTFPMNLIIEKAKVEDVPILLINPGVIYSFLLPKRPLDGFRSTEGAKKVREELRARIPNWEDLDRDALSAVAVGVYFFERDRA